MEECEGRQQLIAILHLIGGFVLSLRFFGTSSPSDNSTAFDPIVVGVIWLLLSGALLMLLDLVQNRSSKALLGINLLPALLGILWCYGLKGYGIAAAFILASIVSAIWSGEVTPLFVVTATPIAFQADIETTSFLLIVVLWISALRAYIHIPIHIRSVWKPNPQIMGVTSGLIFTLVLATGILKMISTLTALTGKQWQPMWNLVVWSTTVAAAGGALLTISTALHMGRIPVRGLLLMAVMMLALVVGIRWLAAIILSASMWETQRALAPSSKAARILIGTDYTAIGSSLLMLGTGIPQGLSKGFMEFAPMETALTGTAAYLLAMGLLASGILEIRRAMSG